MYSKHFNEVANIVVDPNIVSQFRKTALVAHNNFEQMLTHYLPMKFDIQEDQLMLLLYQISLASYIKWVYNYLFKIIMCFPQIVSQI